MPLSLINFGTYDFQNSNTQQNLSHLILLKNKYLSKKKEKDEIFTSNIANGYRIAQQATIQNIILISLILIIFEL